MKQLSRNLFVSLLITFFIAIAFSDVCARENWVKVATLRAGGGGKEVALPFPQVARCKIRCLSGVVAVNVVWLREGGRRTEFKVGALLKPRQERVIELGKTRSATALRIGDSGHGTYEVYVAQPGEKAADPEPWTDLGTFESRGGAQEVTHAGRVSVCRIECTGGRVAVNTVVVRNGPNKKPITVATRLTKGEKVDVQLGDRIPATGFRISTEGRGGYRLLVR